jgi:hypothetical protein
VRWWAWVALGAVAAGCAAGAEGTGGEEAPGAGAGTSSSTGAAASGGDGGNTGGSAAGGGSSGGNAGGSAPGGGGAAPDGGGGSGAGGAPADPCAAAPNDDACDTCRKPTCCPELQACAQNPLCTCWVDCIDQHPGDTVTCSNLCGAPAPALTQINGVFNCQQACADCPAIPWS